MFDFETMTNNEIMERLMDLHRKMAIAGHYGGSGAIEQLQMMIDQCNDVLRDRSMRDSMETMIKNTPSEKNWDAPARKSRNLAKTNGKDTPNNVSRTGGLRINRTSKPVKE